MFKLLDNLFTAFILTFIFLLFAVLAIISYQFYPTITLILGSIILLGWTLGLLEEWLPQKQSNWLSEWAAVVIMLALFGWGAYAAFNHFPKTTLAVAFFILLGAIGQQLEKRKT